MIIARDKMNDLYFDTDALRSRLIIERDQYNNKPLDPGLQCTLQEYIDELNSVIEFVNTMTEAKLKDILAHTPKTKAGKLKNGTTILYMTDMIKWWFNGYHHYTSVAELLIIPKQEEGEYETIFCECRERCKADKPVVNVDGTYNDLSIRKTYLSQDQLIQGKTYLDNKGKEYLYVGKYSIAYYLAGKNIYGEDFIMGNKDLNNFYRTTENVFLYLTNTRKKELAKFSSFGEYMQNYLDNMFKKEHNFNSSSFFKESSIFRVCSEVDTIYSEDKMVCDIYSGFDKNNPPKSLNTVLAVDKVEDYEAHTHFKVWQTRPFTI